MIRMAPKRLYLLFALQPAMNAARMPVLAAFMAGWSANNKYSLFGAIRIISMAVSYEVPLVLGLLGIVLFTQTLSLQDMVEWQRHYHIWLIAAEPVAFVLYF